MAQPAEPLPLSQEEQGRLLARVYAFILSDQFTGASKNAAPEKKSRQKKIAQPHGENQFVDANLSNPEPPA